jgi:hypothetical protein
MSRDPVTEQLLAGERIEDLDAAWDYIRAIDFSALGSKLATAESGKKPWSWEKIEYCEREYRRWLFLCRKHEGELLSPTRAMDEYWHAHMLDTKAYMRDTARIFGKYLHHNPYLGTLGPEDERRLEEAGDRTERYYRAEFREDLYDIASDC